VVDTARPSAVSVVIPTAGRAAPLVRAVHSALAQTRPVHEVIVVHDGSDPADLAGVRAIPDERIRILTTDVPRSGPGRARNTGIKAATGDWVALLDDDDEWLPTKLDHQLAAVCGSPEQYRTVIAGRVERTGPDGTRTWPTRPIGPGELVADYLFVRRSPGEGWLPTPALVVPRDLARAVPFPEGYHQHEDYAWLLDLEARGARFVVVEECVGRVHVADGTASLSAAVRWSESLDWARTRRSRLGPRAFSAFCLTEVSRHARRTPSPRVFATILLAALRGRPRVRDLAQFTATWVVPAWLHPAVNALRERPSPLRAHRGRA
jgi:glycosyltransferase involved in cell wall biosynthesis